MARILVIAYTNYAFDGRVKRHAEALAARGDEVDVLSLADEQDGMINGVNVIGLRIPRYRGASRSSYVRSYLRFFTVATWTAMRLSLKRRYDVAVVCTMPDAAVLCAVPTRLAGTRILLDIHDTMPELYRDKFGGRRGALGARLLMIGERLCAGRADLVLAVHELHRRRLVEAGLPPEKLRVVMNVPDPATFRLAQHRHSDQSDFNLICHGTITHRLGLDVAIEAVAIARHRIPGLRLIVIGSGDYLDEAKRLVGRLNLEEHVCFEEPVPTERLPELLARAHVGLVPNRANSATHLMLPVKLLDYAALGIPTIAARLRTVEHYFGPDASRLFEPGQPVALAAAIEDLYRNPALRLELASKAHRVLERIGWVKQQAEYCRAIDSLLSPPSSPKANPTAAQREAY
jgi:glycosyltransferase involved in cell wall biosynthesis